MANFAAPLSRNSQKRLEHKETEPNQIQKNDQKASECRTWAVVLVGTFETRKENMHHSIWNGNDKKKTTLA